MSVQYIADGYNAQDQRVILWRLSDYTYEVEIGTGNQKHLVKLYETEYYDAVNFFNSLTQTENNLNLA